MTAPFAFTYRPQRWSRSWWLYWFWPPSRMKVDKWLRECRDIVHAHMVAKGEI